MVKILLMKQKQKMIQLGFKCLNRFDYSKNLNEYYNKIKYYLS